MESKTIKMRKIGLLNKGNFAEVYLFNKISKNLNDSNNHNEKLVQKIMYLQKCESGSNVQTIEENMFKNEVNSLSTLSSHPNIVKLYDSKNIDGNIVAIFLEYCDGGNLNKIILQNCKKTEDEIEKITKFYMIQLKNALVFMNNNNIIHRDIKPENILLKKNLNYKYDDIYQWNLKLCDFGFSTTFTNNQEFHDEMCSYYYISPEMLAIKLVKEKNYEKYNWDNETRYKVFDKINHLFGKIVTSYDYKIDVWSFGIVVYEMLFGIVPFFHTTRGKEYLIEKKLKLNMGKFLIDMMLSLNDIYISDFSVNCKNLISSCLKINKNKRFGWKNIANDPWFSEIDSPSLLSLTNTIGTITESATGIKTGVKNEILEKRSNMKIKSEKINTIFI